MIDELLAATNSGNILVTSGKFSINRGKIPVQQWEPMELYIKCKLLAVGSLYFWQWEHPPLAVGNYTASGNSLLAVGMPCAFYSQQLSKNNIVIGLPKLKFVKYHLCSSCELGKAKRKSFQIKTTSSSKRRLELLHMDLCGPMRVESINGKKYVLVIVDDYSRYNWTHFLRSKDETPEVLIDFLRLVQRGLHAQVRIVRTKKEMEFLNKTLHAFFIIAVQTPGSGISILLAVGTPSTGSGNLYCQWELSPGSGNALCILFPKELGFKFLDLDNMLSRV
nr:ribonuclease H-like domain-containing protein [Tanacetum cinerariifolium]